MNSMACEGLMSGCMNSDFEREYLRVTKAQRLKLEELKETVQQLHKNNQEERSKRELLQKQNENLKGDGKRAEVQRQELLGAALQLQSQNGFLKMQLQKLREVAIAKEQDLKMLFAEERHRLIRQLEKLQLERNSLASHLENNNNSLKKEENQIERLKKDLDTSRSQNETLKRRARDIEEEFFRMKSMMEERARFFPGQMLPDLRVEQLTQSLNSSQKYIYEMERNFDSMLMEFDQKISQVKEQYKSQQSRFNQLLQQIQCAKQSTSKQNEQLQEQNKQLRSRLEALSEMIREERGRFVQTLQTQFQQKESIIQKLFETQQALKESLYENRLLRNADSHRFRKEDLSTIRAADSL